MLVLNVVRFSPLDELASALKSSATQSADSHQPKTVKMQKGDIAIVLVVIQRSSDLQSLFVSRLVWIHCSYITVV